MGQDDLKIFSIGTRVLSCIEDEIVVKTRKRQLFVLYNTLTFIHDVYIEKDNRILIMAQENSSGSQTVSAQFFALFNHCILCCIINSCIAEVT